eukprot:TRINITY_DN503_c0_g2_i1.p1 TRINITY_DN503_c0_g2~~TRINITY_DN503_c0_g2_i1.p1  ORF type:complete len:283 (+),score=112.05 TRINITY_DN503_c0_g2_i1:52-849(+)
MHKISIRINFFICFLILNLFNNCLSNEQVIPTGGCHFSPDSVHYIDTIKQNSPSTLTNYLFRGNMPRSQNETYAYDDLKNAILKRGLQEANVSIPENFYLYSISLLNDFEVPDVLLEKNFYEANPTLGQVMRWVIIGSPFDPLLFSEEKREQHAINLPGHQYDKLPERMEQLKNLTATIANRTIVFYIHCEAGHDRTGEFSGSYYLRWLNWQWNDVITTNKQIANRDISHLSFWALQWYCYYLQYSLYYPIDCYEQQETLPSRRI